MIESSAGKTSGKDNTKLNLRKEREGDSMAPFIIYKMSQYHFCKLHLKQKHLQCRDKRKITAYQFCRKDKGDT